MYIMCQEDTEKSIIICYNIFRNNKIISQSTMKPFRGAASVPKTVHIERA